jgi:ammonia channel protein AmtB
MSPQAVNDGSVTSIDKKVRDEVRTIDFLHHEHDHQDNGWGRGIVKDFRKTIGIHWVNEMTNFNQKSIAVSFFIFFAAVAPAITFGAVYSKVRYLRVVVFAFSWDIFHTIL